MAEKKLSVVQKKECALVRQYRIEQGLTQLEFAEKTNLSLPIIKKIENYKVSVSKKSKNKIEAYLKDKGITPEWYDEDDITVELAAAIQQLTKEKSDYVTDIVDCVNTMVSTKNIRNTKERKQYLKFVAATLKVCKDICIVEKRNIKRNMNSELEQEIKLFSMAVKEFAKEIYEENNKKRVD